MYFFFIKRLGVVYWAGLGTRVLDLAKIPDQIAVPLSACLLNIGRKIKAIILTIEKKKTRDGKLEMVLLLLRRKGRRALFWPVGSDSWWVWGYHLHDPPMTSLHLVHGGLEVTSEVSYGQRVGQQGQRGWSSAVCLALPHHRTACLSSGEQPSGVFHTAVKGKKNNIDSSLKVTSTISSKIPFIFLSYWYFVSPVEGSGSCPCLSLWIFHCEPLCSVLPNVTA